jgi:hypothetical protein
LLPDIAATAVPGERPGGRLLACQPDDLVRLPERRPLVIESRVQLTQRGGGLIAERDTLLNLLLPQPSLLVLMRHEMPLMRARTVPRRYCCRSHRRSRLDLLLLHGLELLLNMAGGGLTSLS